MPLKSTQNYRFLMVLISIRFFSLAPLASNGVIEEKWLRNDKVN